MASMKNKKVKYSDSESNLLGLLLKNGGKPISLFELTDKHYDGKKRIRPYTATQSVASIMSSLIKKVHYNGETYEIEKAPRSGPNPMMYRKVKR